jgi:hypothetical protein
MNNIYNAKKSEKDNRDFIYEDFIKFKLNELPSIVDYRNQLLPVRNQGDQGTCYAQSAACMKEWQEYQDYKLNEYLSPQFFYNNRDYMNDNESFNDGDNGMTGRDVMRILKNIGICKETEYMYDNMNRNDNCSDIPEWIKVNALKHRIKSYARVNSLNGLRNDLFYNGPCLIAFPVYGSKNGIINAPMWERSKGDISMGGHAMTVVGYDDTKKHFIIRNSWGTNWGDKGYCYYDYKDWGSHWECWTTIDMDTVINTDDEDESIIDSEECSNDTEESINDEENNVIKIETGIYNVYIDNKKVEDCYLISHYNDFTLENQIYEWKDGYYRSNLLPICFSVNNIDKNGYILTTNTDVNLLIYPYIDDIINDDHNDDKCDSIDSNDAEDIINDDNGYDMDSNDTEDIINDDHNDVEDSNDTIVKIEAGKYAVYLNNKRIPNCYLISYYNKFILENEVYKWQDRYYRHKKNYNETVFIDRIDNDGYILMTINNNYLTIYPYDEEDYNDQQDNDASSICPCSIM